MDRDDMVDTGATVATAAGIRQARRKVYRKIYRTLYAGVPKRVGPIVALGSILSRFTKTAAPYDYTQIGYEGVMPSMISKESSGQAGLQARVKETSSPLYAFKAALERNKTAAALAPIRKMHKGVLRDMLDYKRMATAGWEKQVARNNIHDIIGGIRAGEAAQRASKAMPTATNYKAMMDASGIRNMDSTLYKKLRHRYGNI